MLVAQDGRELGAVEEDHGARNGVVHVHGERGIAIRLRVERLGDARAVWGELVQHRRGGDGRSGRLAWRRRRSCVRASRFRSVAGRGGHRRAHVGAALDAAPRAATAASSPDGPDAVAVAPGAVTVKVSGSDVPSAVLKRISWRPGWLRNSRGTVAVTRFWLA